jgi:hypothetical protein
MERHSHRFIEYELLGDNGQIETLLRVAPYDFYWQMTYRLANSAPAAQRCPPTRHRLV